jgi:hypothetical protein
LAGEAAADEVHCSEVCFANRSDIVEELRLRPVLSEHRAAERLALDLPNRVTETGPLQAKLEPTDP